MSEQTRPQSAVLLGSVLGCALGAIVAYLFFTEQGTALRRQAELKLGDLEGDVRGLRDTLDRAARVASESWSLVDTVAASEPVRRLRSVGMKSAA